MRLVPVSVEGSLEGAQRLTLLSLFVFAALSWVRSTRTRMPASILPLSEQTPSRRSSFEQDGPSYRSSLLSPSFPRKLGQLTETVHVRSATGLSLKGRAASTTQPLLLNTILFCSCPRLRPFTVSLRNNTHASQGAEGEKRGRLLGVVAYREAGGWMELEERSSWALPSCFPPLVVPGAQERQLASRRKKVVGSATLSPRSFRAVAVLSREHLSQPTSQVTFEQVITIIPDYFDFPQLCLPPRHPRDHLLIARRQRSCRCAGASGAPSRERKAEPTLGRSRCELEG